MDSARDLSYVVFRFDCNFVLKFVKRSRRPAPRQQDRQSALGALTGAGVSLAPAPDRHDQRVGDDLRCHRRAYRPAHDAARERVDHGGHIMPASLARNRRHSRSAQVAIPLVVQHHPQRALAHLVRMLVRCLAHKGATFSGVATSGIFGAAQGHS